MEIGSLGDVDASQGAFASEVCSPSMEKFRHFEESRKTSQVAALFFKSAIVWSSVIILAFLSFVPFPINVCIVAIGVIAANFFSSYVPKRLVHEGVLLANLMFDILARHRLLSQQPYYSQILPGVWLGALPAKNHGRELLQNCKIKAVLSILQDEELQGETFFFLPVKPSDWEKCGVRVKQIQVPDKKSLSIQQLHEAADFIKRNREGIYIHCRSGCGRSVMGLIAYLIKYENMSYKAAETFIKEKRPCVGLEEWQEERLREFEVKVQPKHI